MHSLPGGKFAPPPPVSRIFVAGLAFFATGIFSFGWAGVATLHALTAKDQAVFFVSSLLEKPTAEALYAERQRDPDAPRYEYVRDLVRFDLDRNAASDVNIVPIAARQRALALWGLGYPKDPGLRRTETGYPRSAVTLFSEDRHKKMEPAMVAALFGAGAALLICVVMAVGAARFALPGAGVLFGYFLLRYHVWLANFWLHKNGPSWHAKQFRVRDAAFDPGQKLLFVAITLIAAGAVYSALLGGSKAAVKERRRRSKKQSPPPEPAVDKVGD